MQLSTATPWSTQEKQIIRENRDLSPRRLQLLLAGEGFNRTADSIRSAKGRYSYSNPLEEIEAEEESYGMLSQIPSFVEHRPEPYFHLDGRKTRQILVVSDLHIPFEDEESIRDALEAAKELEIREAVLNGDILEEYAVSSWKKNKLVPLLREYIKASEWIEELAARFDRLHITKGNHELRLDSYFAREVDPVVSFLIDPDIIGRIVDGERYDERGKRYQVPRLKNVVYRRGADAWWTKIGKTIFCHPKRSSAGKPTNTSIKACEYFKREGIDFDSIVVSHVHKCNKAHWQNIVCVETGSMCKTLPYTHGEGAFQPHETGYTIIEQDSKGRTNFNSIDVVWLKTLRRINIEEE